MPPLPRHLRADLTVRTRPMYTPTRAGLTRLSMDIAQPNNHTYSLNPSGRRLVAYRLVALILFILLLRIVSFLFVTARTPTHMMDPDSWSYNDSARGIVKYGGFYDLPVLKPYRESEHFQAKAAADPRWAQSIPDDSFVAVDTFEESPEDYKPMLTRTPGYPAFLASVYFLLGHSPRAAVTIQILLSGVTLLLIHAITQRFGGSGAALVAVGWAGVDAVQFYYSQLLLTDTIFTLLVTGSCCCFLHIIFQDTRQALWCLASGLFMASATLVRPMSYYLPVVLMLALASGRTVLALRSRQLVFLLGLLILPSLLLVGGWQYRNWRVAGFPSLTTIAGLNLYYYRVADMVAREQGIPLAVAQKALDKQLPVEQQSPFWWYGISPEKHRVLVERAVEHIAAHQTAYLETAWWGMIRTVSDPGDRFLYAFYLADDRHFFQKVLDDLYSLKPAQYYHLWYQQITSSIGYFYLFAALTLALLGLYGGALAGLASEMACTSTLRPGDFCRKRRMSMLVLTGIVVYFLAVGSGGESHWRFRLPFSPILCVLAGLGTERMLRHVRKGWEGS